MPNYDYDLIVIGSGPAGQRAAIQAAKLDKRVAIIEGARVLVGDSTIEHWNAPLPMESADDTLVQVIGLVVGSYRARKR